MQSRTKDRQTQFDGKTWNLAKRIADELGLTEHYIQTLGNQGKIPSVKIGKFRWYNLGDVRNSLRTEVNTANVSAKFDQLAGI